MCTVQENALFFLFLINFNLYKLIWVALFLAFLRLRRSQFLFIWKAHEHRQYTNTNTRSKWIFSLQMHTTTTTKWNAI